MLHRLGETAVESASTVALVDLYLSLFKVVSE